MHAVLVLAALTLTPAQVDAPPPPPTFEEPSADELAPPSPPSPFDDDAPPLPSDPAATPPVAKDAPPSSADAPEGEAAGLSAFPRGSLQVVGGCATIAVMGVLSGIPVIGWYCIAPLSGLLTPALIGVVETTVGDAAGQTRGALLWPVLGAYAAQFLGAGLTLAATVGVTAALGGGLFAFIGGGGGVPDPGAFAATLLGGYAAVLAVAVTGALLTLAATVVTPALIYAMTAEPKQPGDDEFRFPGVLSPAHAEPAKEAKAPSSPSAPTAVAMAY